MRMNLLVCLLCVLVGLIGGVAISFRLRPAHHYRPVGGSLLLVMYDSENGKVCNPFEPYLHPRPLPAKGTFDVDAARRAGYSDEEIARHLAEEKQKGHILVPSEDVRPAKPPDFIPAKPEQATEDDWMSRIPVCGKE